MGSPDCGFRSMYRFKSARSKDTQALRSKKIFLVKAIIGHNLPGTPVADLQCAHTVLYSAVSKQLDQNTLKALGKSHYS